MPDDAFFRPELFDFLRQLKRHNNREPGSADLF